MKNKIKLYEVRDNGAFIGTKYAVSPQAAINSLLDELNAGAGAFRRSWTRIKFTNPTAIEIEPRKKD